MKIELKRGLSTKPGRDKLARARPYWHVDLKWIFSILLGMLLFVTLPVAGAYLVTDRGPAVDIVAYTMAGLTSPKGIDSDEGLSEIRARVIQNGPEVVNLGGVEVTFTASDLETMSPRELRLKVFRAFANEFYDAGATGIAQKQGLDKKATEQFKNDSTFIGALGVSSHNFIGGILIWFILAIIAVGSAVVYFSHRFGKLVSPGIIFVLMGLPGILLAIITIQNPEVSGAARSESATDMTSAIGTFASFVMPLVIPYFAKVYVLILEVGVGLLLAAILGKIIYSIVKKRKAKQNATDAN